MKTSRTARACGAAVLSALILLASAASSQAQTFGDLTYYVTLNVSSLTSNGNGPFSLDLQLNTGSGNVTNTVTLSNFTFTNGSATGSPNFTLGGETGSLTSSVTLTNSSATNELAQAFSGTTTQISFAVDETSNSELVSGGTAIPDQFSVYLDDATGSFIPTTDSVNSTLVTEAITAQQTLGSVSTFSSTSPDGGVTASVSAVPEPGSAAMLVLGVAGLCARRRTFRRA